MESVKSLSENIKKRKSTAREMGGVDAIKKQHDRGKLTARERVRLLFDADTFQEYGVLATHHSHSPDMKGKVTPADGVITGIGMIDGRPACVAAYDFTVMAGSMGEVGERKVARMREIALRERIPIIWLLDSAGARIQELAGAHFAGTGKLFFDQVLLSGVVPQVAAVMGPTAAGTSYIPALADFVPMVKGTSSMALAGAPLVKAAINEDISTEDLGGSKVHTVISGCADMEVNDDKECIETVKTFLSYFPPHSGLRPKRKKSASKIKLEIEPGILDILPEDSRRAYDMKKIISHIVDPDSFFELKSAFAKNMITGLARIDGWPIGVLANQPSVMGGAIDHDAADKATRFLNLCDAYHIPVLFLHDCPGFMVGSRMEKLGIIRHGAKMLFAVSEITVPKFSVVIRRSYGAGYYVMCGKGFEPDLLVGWPGAEISLMSPEGAVNIIFRKDIKAAKDPELARGEKVERYRQMIGGDQSAAQGFLDDIIDPRETRRILAHALFHTRNKRVTHPKKKRGISPV